MNIEPNFMGVRILDEAELKGKITMKCMTCGMVEDGHRPMFKQYICARCRSWYRDICQWARARHRLIDIGIKSDLILELGPRPMWYLRGGWPTGMPGAEAYDINRYKK
jgi:hypothetical protein